MTKRLTGTHAYSTAALAVGRLCRAGAVPCLIAAALLITACDKSSTSAPRKAPAPGGSSQPQKQAGQTATPDKPYKPAKLSDKPSAMARYTNEKNGFAVDFPATWKLEKDPDRIFTIMASSPQENPQDPFSENVYILVKDLPENLSVNDYFDVDRINFPRISENAVEKSIGQILVNGQACPWVIFTHSFNKVNMKTIRYYVRHEQKVFVLACTSTPESFEKYRDTFQQIANSITFE